MDNNEYSIISTDLAIRLKGDDFSNYEMLARIMFALEDILVELKQLRKKI